jgi:membrane protease YdiL (CAAX protease family)
MENITPNTFPPSRSLLKRIFISPDEPRLRAGWRVILQFILMLVLLYLFQFLIYALYSRGWLGNGALLNLLGQLSSLFAITLSVFLVRRALDRRSFISLGLKINLHALWDLIAGLCITGVIFLLIYVIEYNLGWISFYSFAWNSQSISQIILGMLAMFAIFITVGWQEELFSRGYQLQNLADGVNTPVAVGLSSLIFAFLHAGNPNITWVAFIGLFLAGVFMAYAYLRTRQLWLPIGLHIGWNFFEGAVFGFQVSGLESYRLILQNVEGPTLITGGPFGPEAGLILLPALLVGTFFVYIYTKNRIVGNQLSDAQLPDNQESVDQGML